MHLSWTQRFHSYLYVKCWHLGQGTQANGVLLLLPCNGEYTILCHSETNNKNKNRIHALYEKNVGTKRNCIILTSIQQMSNPCTTLRSKLPERTLGL